MKKAVIVVISAICICSSVLMGCSNKGNADIVRKVNNEHKRIVAQQPKQNSSIIAGNNKLSYDVMNKIIEDGENKNVLISPLSLSTILALTENGALKDTKEEMLKVMELDNMSDEEINKEYNNLIQYYNNSSEDSIKIANSMWLRYGADCKEGFKNTASSYYGADINELDFAKEKAVDVINDWTYKNTNGKIKKALETIDKDTFMILINSLYFKDNWSEQFNERATKSEKFILSDGKEINVPMMKDERGVPYLADENFTAIKLYYDNTNTSMYILLPVKSIDIDTFIQSMDNNKMEKYIEKFKYTEANIQIPKFKFEYEKELVDILKSLGMKAAFNGAEADFANINDEMYIDLIKQKCFIAVDENGTEAAAVTVEDDKCEAMEEENKPIDFIVNRPFMFIIIDEKLGTTLFMGKIENPLEK
jgi:serine protease inhibitor